MWPLIAAALAKKKEQNAKVRAGAQQSMQQGVAAGEQAAATTGAANPLATVPTAESGSARPLESMLPADRQARVNAVYKLGQGNLGGAAGSLFDSTRLGQTVAGIKKAPSFGDAVAGRTQAGQTVNAYRKLAAAKAAGAAGIPPAGAAGIPPAGAAGIPPAGAAGIPPAGAAGIPPAAGGGPDFLSILRLFGGG